MIDYKTKHKELMERFQTSMTNLHKNKDLLEKVHNRNFLEKLFANTSRDLADVGIAQNELLNNCYTTLQEVIKLSAADAERNAEIVQTIKEMMQKITGINDDFRQNFIDLFKKAVEQKKVLEDHEYRIISQEQLNKLILDIKECGVKQAEYSNIDLFCRICKSIAKYLSGVSISNNHKREILLEVLSGGFGKIAGEELNACQEQIFNIFSAPSFQSNKNSGMWNRFIFKQQPLDKEREFSMSEIISGTLDAIAVQESERYIAYRDRLVSFLDEFLAKGIDVNGEHSRNLSAIRKRLHEDQFEIALIGEFQGGKSTTFNLLCDGREISPRGLNGGGIKTSAAVISAQNIDDDETRDGLNEWAEICWLSKEEMKRRIMNVLAPYAEVNADRQEIVSEEPDFPLEEMKELLENVWSKNPQGDELELLRIATLQFRLLYNSNLERLTFRKIVAVNEFQSLVRFPQNWEARWAGKLDADFTEEECLFSIVDRVNVHIHSESLARIGCKITDCPGLFVSRWDTERAEAVMCHSNAIWYLLNGSKQIGNSDKKALQRIKDFKLMDKCFFSVNRRKSRASSEAILKEDAAMLEALDFHPEHIFMYDAFLAFRTAQITLAHKGMSERDLECLAEESRGKNILSDVLNDLKTNPAKCEQALKKMIQKHLLTQDEDGLADELEELEAVSSEFRESLLCESGINDILSAIEKLIITQRARSILITNGSQECIRVLKHLQANFKQKEKATTETLEQAQKEAESARMRLKDFCIEFERRFEFLSQKELDHALARDFYDSREKDIVSQIDTKAREICKKTWDEWHIFDDVNRIATRRIQDEFLQLMRKEVKNYAQNLQTNKLFKATILTPFAKAKDEMSIKWSEEKEKEKLFASVEVLTYVNTENLQISSFEFKGEAAIDLPWYSWELLKDIGTLWLRRFVQNPADRIDEFFDDKHPVTTAYYAFKGDNRNTNNLIEILGSPRKTLKREVEQSVLAMMKRLESNIRTREEVAKESNERKVEIAREARNARETIVEPYMEKLESFEKEVCHFYAE